MEIPSKEVWNGHIRGRGGFHSNYRPISTDVGFGISMDGLAVLTMKASILVPLPG